MVRRGAEHGAPSQGAARSVCPVSRAVLRVTQAKSVSEIARHVVQILVFLAINGKLLGIAGTRE